MKPNVMIKFSLSTSFVLKSVEYSPSFQPTATIATPLTCH